MNVLLFMSDEHNPFYSSPYGHRQLDTPNMQRLADTGTLYENAYCPSPLCVPGRSAFLSGRRVHQIQQYNNCQLIHHEHPGYGSVLAKQGIHTAYIGKLHTYNASEFFGFSEMFSKEAAKDGDGCLSRQPLAIRHYAAARFPDFGPRAAAFRDDTANVDRCLRWLQETAPGLNKPWLFVLNTLAPHFPHHVTQPLWDKYAGDLPAYGLDRARHPYADDLRQHFQTDRITEEQIRGQRRAYLGCVDWVDQQLGRVLDTLAKTGQLDDTVVIYTSDHGEMLGKFGMWWKCSLYEDSVRVPLIISGPGFGGGQRVTTPVDLLDLQATLFDIFDAQRPADWVGQPLLSIASDRTVFSEYHGHGTRASSYLIRKGDWKLIWCAAAPHLLFNLAEDPDELHDLATVRPEKLAELEAELRRICDPELEQARAEAFIQRQLAAAS